MIKFIWTEKSYLVFLLQKEDQLLLKEIGAQGEGDPAMLQGLIDDVSTDYSSLTKFKFL